MSNHKSHKADRVKTKVTALLGCGEALTHQQIADIAGCSTKTVQRLVKKIKPDVTEVEEKLTEYRNLLRKRLPIEKRVEIIQQIAMKAETNPFAALKAVQKADEMDGLTVEPRRLEEEERHQPMFILPAGAQVQVHLHPNPQEQKQKSVRDIEAHEVVE